MWYALYTTSSHQRASHSTFISIMFRNVFNICSTLFSIFVAEHVFAYRAQSFESQSRQVSLYTISCVRGIGLGLVFTDAMFYCYFRVCFSTTPSRQRASHWILKSLKQRCGARACFRPNNRLEVIVFLIILTMMVFNIFMMSVTVTIFLIIVVINVNANVVVCQREEGQFQQLFLIGIQLEIFSSCLIYFFDQESLMASIRATGITALNFLDYLVWHFSVVAAVDFFVDAFTHSFSSIRIIFSSAINFHSNLLNRCSN